MTHKPFVSIIIPNYNNANLLPACLESCLAQKEWVKEIIVVDDHSSDESILVLEKFEKAYPDLIQYYINPKKGANHARNYGYEKSTGNYIQWLDSDDLLLERKFENQMPELEGNHGDIVYSDFRFDYYSDGEFKSTEEKNFSHKEDYLLELLKDNWNTLHSYLMKRSIAEKLKGSIGWNPATKVGQDREYMTMAGLMGAKFVYVSGVYAVYNKQNSGTISGIDFKRRLELNQHLEEKFRKTISLSDLISDQKKKQYIKVLNTHKVKACFYNRRIKLDCYILPWSIDWSLMHWKMLLVVPIILLYKNIELIFHNK